HSAAGNGGVLTLGAPIPTPEKRGAPKTLFFVWFAKPLPAGPPRWRSQAARPPPRPPISRQCHPAVTPMASRHLIVARSRSRSRAASLSRAIFQSLSNRYSSVVIRSPSVVPHGSLILATASTRGNQKSEASTTNYLCCLSNLVKLYEPCDRLKANEKSNTVHRQHANHQDNSITNPVH